jgi:hypothetical protein
VEILVYSPGGGLARLQDRWVPEQILPTPELGILPSTHAANGTQTVLEGAGRMNNRYPWAGYSSSAAEKYEKDPHYRTLVDTFTSFLWNGQFSPSEIREAAILAVCQMEAVRIRPLLFDPRNYEIEKGVLTNLKQRSETEIA